MTSAGGVPPSLVSAALTRSGVHRSDFLDAPLSDLRELLAMHVRTNLPRVRIEPRRRIKAPTEEVPGVSEEEVRAVAECIRGCTNDRIVAYVIAALKRKDQQDGEGGMRPSEKTLLEAREQFAKGWARLSDENLAALAKRWRGASSSNLDRFLSGSKAAGSETESKAQNKAADALRTALAKFE